MDRVKCGRHVSYNASFEVKADFQTRSHTHTWSGKNSKRKGPRRIMPKLSGSSLLFTRLTLRRQRHRKKETWNQQNPADKTEPENNHINKKNREEAVGKIYQRRRKSQALCMTTEPNLQSPHHSVWVWDACFGQCAPVFHKYRGTTKYTSFQTFLRVGSVLLLFHWEAKNLNRLSF